MESFANMLEKELKLVCTTFEVGKGESFFIWKGEETKKGLKIVYRKD